MTTTPQNPQADTELMARFERVCGFTQSLCDSFQLDAASTREAQTGALHLALGELGFTDQRIDIESAVGRQIMSVVGTFESLLLAGVNEVDAFDALLRAASHCRSTGVTYRHIVFAFARLYRLAVAGERSTATMQ